VGNSAQQPISDIDRPPHSYIALISMAILTKNDRKILLNEIYDWVIQNFPYYQHRTDKSWRNSIRHNLSLNECFIKVGKAGNGRGYYWSIHSANINDFKKGDFRRRQARLRAKHDKGSSGASTTSGSEPVSGLINTSKGSAKQAQHQNNNSSKIGTSWPTSSSLLNVSNNNSNSSLTSLHDHQKLNGFNNYNMGTNINQSTLSSQQQHQHQQNSMYQSQNGCNENINEVSPKTAFNNSTINYSANSRSYIDQYSNTNHNCQLIATGRELSHNYAYMPNNQISSNSNTQYFFNNNHLNQFSANNFNSNITHIKNEPKQTIDSNILSSNGGDSSLQTHVNNSIAKTATGISTSSSLSTSPSSGTISSSSTSSLSHQNSAIYNLNVLNNFSNNNNFLNSHSYNSNNSSTLISSSSPPSSTSSTSPLASHQQYNYMNSTFPWHSIQTQSLNTNILDNFSASNATLSYNSHSHMYPSPITSNDSNNESLLAYTNQSLNGSQHYQQLIQPHQPQVISNNTNQNIFHNTYTMK
jgi:hypothetical protein